MFIMEIKAFLFNFMNEVSGGDPVARGLIGVWLLTAFSFLARRIPYKIKWWILGQTTVHMTVIKENNSMSQEFFTNFEEYFLKNNKLSNRNRKTTVAQFGNETGFGYGKHLIWIGFRFYTLYKSKIEKAGTDTILDEIMIVTYGRNADIFNHITEFAKKDSGRRYFWQLDKPWAKDPWYRVQELTDGPVLFLDPDVKSVLDKQLDFYKNNREWYKRNGKPYRMNIVLYGPPGTGKTELVRYISNYLKTDIFQCLISRTESDSLMKVANGLVPGRYGLISLEDFESIALSREFHATMQKYQQISRSGTDEEKKAMENDPNYKKYSNIKDGSSKHSGFHLSDLLNVLQGLRVIDDMVIVMTTNHIEIIDEAVLRGSRCDLKLYVGPLGLEQVKAKFEHQYEKPFPNYIQEIKPIKACDLDALSSKNAFDPDGFVAGLIESYGTLDVSTEEETVS